MKIQTQLLFAVLCLLLSSNNIFTKGHLVIIGGGDKPDYMIRKIVELAGGENSKIVIVPMASAEPVETAVYQRDQFIEYGAADVSYIYCSREKAETDSVLSLLDNVTGVFFSGGDQNRLTAVLLNTKFLSKIIDIYENGGVISGTSAGAAVMSKIMITGDELKHPDLEQAFITIEKENIKSTEGFGFIDDAIIDQHFVNRKRYNRLISLVLENPDLVGIGIDEATSIILYPENIIEVMGESQVIIFDPTLSNDILSDEKGFFSASNIVLHILTNGKRYDLSRRRILN